MEENFSTNLRNDLGNIYFRSSCVIMIGNSDSGGNINKSVNSDSQELPVDKIHSFSEKYMLSTNDKPCVEIQPIKNDLWSGSETVNNPPHLTSELKPDQRAADQSTSVGNRLHVINVHVDHNLEFSTDCNQNELNIQTCSPVVKTRVLEVDDSEIVYRKDGRHFEVLSSIGVKQDDEILPVVLEISSDLDQQDVNSVFCCDLDNVDDYRKLINDRCEKLTPKHKDRTNFPKVKDPSNANGSTDSLISKKFRKFEYLEDELTDLCTCPHQDRYAFSLKVGEELKKYFELICFCSLYTLVPSL